MLDQKLNIFFCFNVDKLIYALLVQEMKQINATFKTSFNTLKAVKFL